MMQHMVKTTVTIREDLYQRAKRKAGKRGLSRLINEILAKELAPPKNDLFGSIPNLPLKDIRDHRDRV